jgi:hypothetical protein
MFRRLRRVFKRHDPTEHWVEDASVPLVVDLDRLTLCGVGLGEPVARLAFLGPQDRRWCHGGRERWSGKGLDIQVDAQKRLTGFAVTWLDLEVWLGGNFRAFEGTVVAQGAAVSPGLRTSVKMLSRLIGAPYAWSGFTTDSLPAEYWTVYFEREAAEISAFFCPGHPPGLARISVGEPVLANEGQRKWDGIDQPWPPTPEAGAAAAKACEAMEIGYDAWPTGTPIPLYSRRQGDLLQRILDEYQDAEITFIEWFDEDESPLPERSLDRLQAEDLLTRVRRDNAMRWLLSFQLRRRGETLFAYVARDDELYAAESERAFVDRLAAEGIVDPEQMRERPVEPWYVFVLSMLVAAAMCSGLGYVGFLGVRWVFRGVLSLWDLVFN